MPDKSFQITRLSLHRVTLSLSRERESGGRAERRRLKMYADTSSPIARRPLSPPPLKQIDSHPSSRISYRWEKNFSEWPSAIAGAIPRPLKGRFILRETPGARRSSWRTRRPTRTEATAAATVISIGRTGSLSLSLESHTQISSNIRNLSALFRLAPFSFSPSVSLRYGLSTETPNKPGAEERKKRESKRKGERERTSWRASLRLIEAFSRGKSFSESRKRERGSRYEKIPSGGSRGR